MDRMRVRVLIAFNGMRPGDAGYAIDPDLARKYAALGLIEITEEADHGGGTTGPGGPETGDPGGVAPGTGEGGAPGIEQGEGFGSGEYGAPAGERTDAVPAPVDSPPYG